MGWSDFVAPDWCDASAYAHLQRADRASFAWEWLRRSTDYRSAAVSVTQLPSSYGLCRFEDPSLSAIDSRPLWHSNLDRSVLRAAAHPVGEGETFDVACLGPWASVHIDSEGEHWWIGKYFRSIRIDIVHGTLRNGPVHLDYRIAGLTEAIPAILTLRRFLALACTRQMPVRLFPVETRADRWITMLRVHDAVIAGASQRDIALGLFGDSIIGPRWRCTASSYRLRVQRLVGQAGAMAAGGWRELLNGSRAAIL